MTNTTPALSAISTLLSQASAKSPTEALPLEIYHNLKYQHNWSDLSLHQVLPTQTPSLINIGIPDKTLPSVLRSDATTLISGVPPRHSYIHPDFLNHLVKHDMTESEVPIQREFVLPMSVGEKWSLKRLCAVFDGLPERDVREGAEGFVHQDSKRVLLGMMGHDGMGGDGTVVYYIMQEGEVKPRQN